MRVDKCSGKEAQRYSGRFRCVGMEWVIADKKVESWLTGLVDGSDVAF
jgi:hypothetical protein